MKVFSFIDTEKTVFDVKILCRVCGVSRSSYYEWVAECRDGANEEGWDEAILANRIYDIWLRSRRRYGSPRVTKALAKAGVVVNHKRVERIMTELGISGRHGRVKIRTTVRDPKATPAPDLVRRNFNRERLDQLWVGDITAIPTLEGWLYLAGIVDVASRRCVGWSMADHMRADLVTDALRHAALTRDKVRFNGLVFHSDQGSQYTSKSHRELCESMRIAQSMGSVGDSYDNAMAESFWASLKRETEIHTTLFETREQARLVVFEWLNWYNTERLHSSIDYCSPEEHETRLAQKAAA